MKYIEILQQAELGNAEAQAEVGFCHFWGHKVTNIDYVEAVKWFKKSADQNCAYGQYWMQRCLSEGLGIEPNKSLRKDYADKAFQWFTKEADQTNAKVQLYIGYCYQEGAGTNVNAKSAFEEGANTPAGENLSSFIKIGFSFPAHLIEYGGLDTIASNGSSSQC